MDIVIKAACGCSIGKIRQNNEDNFYFGGIVLPTDNNALDTVYTQKFTLNENPVFAVFDGMGGEEAGEIASFLAADQVSRYFDCQRLHYGPFGELLADMCQGMNRVICDETLRLGSGRMGSTVAMLTFSDDKPYVCNLGDSRIYRLRNDELMQISQDHLEILPPGSARKPRLVQHLGIFEEEMRLEPYIACGSLKRGDAFLLCSDGLTDMVSAAEIRLILKETRSEKRAVERLIALALEHGGRDNITVIVCRIK